MQASITSIASTSVAYAGITVVNSDSTSGFYDEVYLDHYTAAGLLTELRGVPTHLTDTGASVSASVTDTGIFLAQTNTVYTIYLYANTTAGAAARSGNTAQASAFVDPTFQIASSVTDPNDYSILVSDGIGNTATATAAPEPATYALAFAGIGIAGLLAQRRKVRA